MYFEFFKEGPPHVFLSFVLHHIRTSRVKRLKPINLIDFFTRLKELFIDLEE
jgi:hypothetical protein